MITVAQLQAEFTANDAPFRQAMQRAATVVEKMTTATARLTPVERQREQALLAQARAEAQLTTLRQTSDTQLARLAGRYHLLAAAEREGIQNANAAIDAEKKRIQSLDALGDRMAGLGRIIGTTFAGGIVAASGALLKMGADLDAASDKIRLTLGDVGSQAQGLQQSFERVAATVPNSLEDTAQALATVAQRTGLAGRPLEELTRQLLDLARITGQDLNTVLRLSARTFGDWGIAVRDQGAALDLLYRVQTRTGTSISKLQEQLVYFGAPLRQMGFSFVQAATLIGKFEKEGVNAELVLSSLRIALTRLAKAGVTDAGQAFRQIVDGIKSAGSAAKANALALKAFGARAGPDMAAAIREGRFAIDDLVRSVTRSSDGIRRAAKETDDYKETFARLRNQVTLALKPLAQDFFEGLNRIAAWLAANTGKLTAFVTWFQNLRETVGKVNPNIALFGTALVALTGTFATVITQWPRVVEGFVGIRTAVLSANLAVSASAIAFGAAIAALALFVTAYATNFHGLRDDLNRGIAVIQFTFQNLVRNTQELFSNLWTSLVSGLQGFFRNFRNVSLANLRSIPQDFKRGIQVIKGAFSGGFENAQRQAVKAVPGGRGTSFSPYVNVTPEQNARLEAERQAKAERVRMKQFMDQMTRLSTPSVRPSGIMQSLTGLDGKKAGGGKSPAQTEIERLNQSIAESRALLREYGVQATKTALARSQLTLAEKEAFVQYRQAPPDLRLLDLALKRQVQTFKDRADAAKEAKERTAKKIEDAEKALRAEAARVEGQIRARMLGPKSPETVAGQVRAKFPAYSEKQRDLQRAVIDATVQNNAEIAAEKKAAEAKALLAKQTDVLKNRLADLQAAQIKATYGSVKDQVALELLGMTYSQVANRGLRDYIDKIAAQVAWMDEVKRRREQEAAAAKYQQDIIDGLGRTYEEARREGERLRFSGEKGSAAFLRYAQSLDQTDVALQVLTRSIYNQMVANEQLDEAMQAFQTFADGVRGVFESMFNSLFERGFKGFFGNVIQGFSRLLQQMAVQFLTSQLMNVVTRALGSAFGAAFGGGEARAFGGMVAANRPYLVGERGPELFVPRQSGTIQTAGAGGGSVIVNMTVNATDAGSFRRNEAAIQAALLRAADRANRRNGG